MGKLAAIQSSSSIQFKIRLFVLILILTGLSSGCRGRYFKKSDNFEPLMVTEKPEQRSSRAFASTRLRPAPGAETQATAPRPGPQSRQISDDANASISDEEALEELPDDGTLTAEQRAIFQTQMTAIQNAAIKNRVTGDLLEGNEDSPNPVTTASASNDASSNRFSMSDGDESSEFEANTTPVPRSQATQNLVTANSPKPDASKNREAAKASTDRQALQSANKPESNNKPVHSQSREGERAAKAMAAVAPLNSHNAQNSTSTETRKPNTPPLADPAVLPASANVAIKDNNVDNQNSNNNFEKSSSTAVAIETLPGDWRLLAQESLAALQAEAESSTTLSPSQKLAIETKKRLLSLVLDDLEGAMTPIEFLAPDEREYFVHQFQALHAAIDPQGNPVINRRWTIALQSQRKAQSHLATVSNLEVQNVAFCNEVDSFGIISKFPQYHFRRDQELLLYCELDNFVAEKLKNEYETKLQGSYEIVDSNGRRVADQMLPPDVHVCNNQRRDYFIAYRMYMPQQITPGRYSLKLTIEDMKGHKFGQSSVDFQIMQ